MKFEARKKDDGCGPYRWRPVMSRHGGLALGGIYEKPHDLKHPPELPDNYEWREVHP